MAVLSISMKKMTINSSEKKKFSAFLYIDFAHNTGRGSEEWDRKSLLNELPNGDIHKLVNVL